MRTWRAERGSNHLEYKLLIHEWCEHLWDAWGSVYAGCRRVLRLTCGRAEVYRYARRYPAELQWVVCRRTVPGLAATD